MSTSADTLARAMAILAHDGEHAYEAVVPPIAQTSLFTFGSYAEMEETYRGQKVRSTYTRGLNPTVRLFEEKMAALECGEDAIGFASGMAAISSAVLAFVQPGDRIVCVEHVYPDAYRLFQTYLKRMNVMVEYVDGRDLDAVRRAMPGARLIYMESPTSWLMHVHDVAALAQIAHDNDVLSIIDNSWASPIFQQPLTLGVDLVVHSASKYIGGHSDVVAGVVVGSSKLISEIRSRIYPYFGGKLSPFDAWLLLRGLRTLPIRMKAHEASALHVARQLAERPDVVAVYHPGLSNTLPDGLQGTSGLFSFEFDGSVNIARFADALRLFKLGVSWGGHESLMVPAQVVRVQAAGPNSAIDFGVSERIVRLHVGLEGQEALLEDLSQAMREAKMS
ncbi:PLP-dependent transferase [Microvirga sp. BT688]|uniref:PLP-dependent transferase n=1 Tax=Microvirga sp. TaxID=1873136 RepID=UPI001681DF22|nr:PLP-dependent transferase [Microvirga sp.]MBD2750956.1 PLP-dependent transferase [Microvirga sp.]